MKSTNKDMADSFFTGSAKGIEYGVRVMATSYKDIKSKIKAKMKKIQVKWHIRLRRMLACEHRIKTKICFYFMRCFIPELG